MRPAAGEEQEEEEASDCGYPLKLDAEVASWASCEREEKLWEATDDAVDDDNADFVSGKSESVVEVVKSRCVFLSLFFLLLFFFFFCFLLFLSSLVSLLWLCFEFLWRSVVEEE